MRTALSGPIILYGNDNPQQISDTDAGPNIDYQGNALIDSRYVSAAVAAPTAGGINSWFIPSLVEDLVGIPRALGGANIAAAQAATNGGFFTLASANAAGIAVNVPFIPQGSPITPGSTAQVNVLALDFGMALCTTTTAAATAKTVTITGPVSAAYALRFFYPGQRLIIPGAGASSTLPLFCTVLATPTAAAAGSVVSAAGTVTVDTAAGTVVTASAVGTADRLYGIVASPVIAAGAANIYDPAQLVARTLSVTASGGASGSVLVRGYDIYGQAMSESITIVGSGVSTTQKKAFKYISSAQAIGAGVTTGTLSIGTTDVFGFGIRSDLFEYTDIYYNGALITASTGWLAADITSPATTTTGDVRGTYAVQSASDGTKKLIVFQVPAAAQACKSTNIDNRLLAGVVQA